MSRGYFRETASLYTAVGEQTGGPTKIKDFACRIYARAGYDEIASGGVVPFARILWVVACAPDKEINAFGYGNEGDDQRRIRWTDSRNVNHDAAIKAVRMTSTGKRMEVTVTEDDPNHADQPPPPGPPPEDTVVSWTNGYGETITTAPPDASDTVTGWTDGNCTYHSGTIPADKTWIGGGC